MLSLAVGRSGPLEHVMMGSSAGVNHLIIPYAAHISADKWLNVETAKSMIRKHTDAGDVVI